MSLQPLRHQLAWHAHVRTGNRRSSVYYSLASGKPLTSNSFEGRNLVCRPCATSRLLCAMRMSAVIVATVRPTFTTCTGKQVGTDGAVLPSGILQCPIHIGDAAAYQPLAQGQTNSSALQRPW